MHRHKLKSFPFNSVQPAACRHVLNMDFHFNFVFPESLISLAAVKVKGREEMSIYLSPSRRNASAVLIGPVVRDYAGKSNIPITFTEDIFFFPSKSHIIFGVRKQCVRPSKIQLKQKQKPLDKDISTVSAHGCYSSRLFWRITQRKQYCLCFWGVAHLFSFLWEPAEGRIKNFVCLQPLVEIARNVRQLSDQPTPLIKQRTFGANALLAVTPHWMFFRTIVFCQARIFCLLKLKEQLEGLFYPFI